MSKETRDAVANNYRIMEITVRPATNDDATVIADFNRAMATETEHKTLDAATIYAGVRSLVSRPEHGFYLVAETENRVVGCLMVTFEWSDWRNGLFWWIQSVYVHPEYRRRGVFKALYKAVETQAHNTPDVCGLRLYVEQDNDAAQKTYAALGMTETPYRVFESELPLKTR